MKAMREVSMLEERHSITGAWGLVRRGVPNQDLGRVPERRDARRPELRGKVQSPNSAGRTQNARPIAEKAAPFACPLARLRIRGVLPIPPCAFPWQ